MGLIDLFYDGRLQLMVDGFLDNFAHGVSAALESRIVNVENTSTSASSDQDPVVSVHDVGNDTMASLDTRADLGLRGTLNGNEGSLAEAVDGTPHDIATSSIAAVGLWWSLV